MADKIRSVLVREMLYDLAYRLRLADDLFVQAAESLASASVLEEWESRSEACRRIRAYARALRIIDCDLSHTVEGRVVVFPAEIEAWNFGEPGGCELARQLLTRLHTVARGMEFAVERELLRLEVKA